MTIHTIFFDLDNTLYPRDSGIWEAIGNRINLFMTDIMQIPEQNVHPLRTHFRNEFGTTLAGLQSISDVNENEFLEFVHDINLNEMLEDDGSLYQMLEQIPQRKIIFTNSDKTHAKRVLNFFGIKDLFELIVDVIAMKPYFKPHPEAYKLALEMAGLENSQGCMFIDDLLENVQQAKQSGFISAYIGDNSDGMICMPDIFALPNILEKQFLK